MDKNQMMVDALLKKPNPFDGLSDVMPFGTGSPAETAGNNQLSNIVSGAANSIFEIPKRFMNGVGQYELGAGDTPQNRQAVGQSLMTAIDLAGMGTPFAAKGAVGIFGGKLAQTADHAALAKAEQMTAQGVDRAAIYKDTGWFQGADKQWRFEIPDNAHSVDLSALSSQDRRAKALAELPPDLMASVMNLPAEQIAAIVSPAKAGSYLKHDALYAAYPDLKNISVSAPTKESSYVGSFDHANKRMQTSGSSLDPSDIVRGGDGTAIHELQHAVQGIEGFERGSNPAAAGGYDPYFRTSGEVEARNASRRRYLSPDARQRMLPWETADVPEAQQIIGLSKNNISPAFGQISPDPMIQALLAGIGT